MKALGFDLETTGFFEEGHRIVEIWAGIWSVEERRLESQIFFRIDPCRSIPAEAQRVHGISGMDLIGKPKFEEAVAEIDSFFKDEGADFIVGHNCDDFDIPFLNMELARAGRSPIAIRSIDTSHARWATPTGKTPTLGELSFACDVEYNPELAHAAEYDVSKTMECLFKGLDFGRFSLEETKINGV